MKWIGNRISFNENSDVATFVIYPEKKGINLSLMGAWCAMWLTIGIVMIWAFFTLQLTQTEQIIVIVFMSFWAYYAQRVGRSFLWMLWGKEMIKINQTELVYKKAIKKYGKAVPYFHENIHKIRMSVPKDNSIQQVWESSPWVVGGERLEFDYMGKVIRFARKIDEKEAKMIFQMITKRVDAHLRKAAKRS